MKVVLWASGLVLSSAVAVAIVLFNGRREESQLADKCATLASGEAIGAQAAKASWIKADDKAGTPAHCEVSATLSPVEGSKIGVVYRLPADWNGKLLGLGGGGWAGNVKPETAAPGLQAGYATAQTDGGHPGTDPWNNAWAASPVATDDFGWRAVHEMTVAAKELVVAFYGKAAARAFFQGCSTGGRQGLMEAQRFPGDYDGIVAGAPVLSLQVQTSQLMRSNLFSAPGAALDKAQVSLVNQAVLAACDGNDGQEDGIIDDPRTCRWDPGELACKPGESGGQCLSEPQVAALRTAYSGLLAPDGSWAQWPLGRGGEENWMPFIAVDGKRAKGTDGGFRTLGPVVFGDRKVDFDHLKGSDVVAARSSSFAETYEATDPDIADFLTRGGKLMIYQGESDPGPSAVGAIDYVTAATQHAPTDAQAGLRLFVMPGMGHCGGGPGPDQVDWLDALDSWVNTGNAPAQLVATKKDSALTRPVCAWPQIAHYKGEGDSNDPASYDCAARSISPLAR